MFTREPRGLCCAGREHGPPCPQDGLGGAPRLARRPPGLLSRRHPTDTASARTLCRPPLHWHCLPRLAARPGLTSPACPPRSPAPQMPRQPRGRPCPLRPPHPLYPGASAPNPSPARSTWSDHRCHLSGSLRPTPHPAARGLLAPHPIRVPDARSAPSPGPQPPSISERQLCFVRSPPATRAPHLGPHALKGQGPRGQPRAWGRGTRWTQALSSRLPLAGQPQPSATALTGAQWGPPSTARRSAPLMQLEFRLDPRPSDVLGTG